MKNIANLIFFLFILSCARQPEKKINNDTTVSLENIEILESESINALPTNASYTLLIKQKLQEYLDKEKLWSRHPEFNAQDTLQPIFKKLNHTKATEIKQVVLVDAPKPINDSITKLLARIYFSDNKLDTIICYIKNSKIELEGAIFKTSKITFEKYNASL